MSRFSSKNDQKGDSLHLGSNGSVTHVYGSAHRPAPGSYQLTNPGIVTSSFPICVGNTCTNPNGTPIYGFGEARSFHGQTIHVTPSYSQSVAVNVVYGIPPAGQRPWS